MIYDYERERPGLWIFETSHNTHISSNACLLWPKRTIKILGLVFQSSNLLIGSMNQRVLRIFARIRTCHPGFAFSSLFHSSSPFFLVRKLILVILNFLSHLLPHRALSPVCVICQVKYLTRTRPLWVSLTKWLIFTILLHGCGRPTSQGVRTS